jgi:hypothetical protein
MKLEIRNQKLEPETRNQKLEIRTNSAAGFKPLLLSTFCFLLSVD